MLAVTFKLDGRNSSILFLSRCPMLMAAPLEHFTRNITNSSPPIRLTTSPLRHGKGRPHHLIGKAIPMTARIALVSQVVDVFHQIGGKQRALKELQRRSATWFDPEVVEALEKIAGVGDFWEILRSDELEAAVHNLEPRLGVISVDEDRLDAIAVAFAEVVDAKSPYTFGHSTRVAHYADAVAEEMGLSPEHRRWLYRGALLHDIGKLGVSNSILDKPGSLTPQEWEEVKAHPRYTEEILSRIGPFAEKKIWYKGQSLPRSPQTMSTTKRTFRPGVGLDPKTI